MKTVDKNQENDKDNQLSMCHESNTMPSLIDDDDDDGHSARKKQLVNYLNEKYYSSVKKLFSMRQEKTNRPQCFSA